MAKAGKEACKWLWIEELMMVLKSRRRLAVGVLTALVLTVPGLAEAKTGKGKADTHKAQSAADGAHGGCKPTPEQASIGIRALQTELMVAGLKCSAEQWNSFTAKFKTTIKSDADRMQRLFTKTYGKAGPNQMNGFVTQLANEASQRSNAYSEIDYCRQEDQLFQKVLALTAGELELFSAKRTLNVPAPVALCGPDTEAPSSSPLVTTAAASGTAPSIR